MGSPTRMALPSGGASVDRIKLDHNFAALQPSVGLFSFCVEAA